jgi:hypothetical protein
MPSVKLDSAMGQRASLYIMQEMARIGNSLIFGGQTAHVLQNERFVSGGALHPGFGLLGKIGPSLD